MSRQLEFLIGDEFDGKKIQSFLRGHLKMSARLVTSLKRIENGILLNGCHARTIDIKKGRCTDFVHSRRRTNRYPLRRDARDYI